MAKKKKGNKNLGSLPDEFLERLTALVGLSSFENIRKTFVTRPTTFRVNTIKTLKHESIKAGLVSKGFKLQSVPWYKDAYILLNKSKRELTELDIYKEGKIYIQSLASMVPPIVLDPKPGEVVLDLTAAPGSKTSQMAAMMNKVGELVANDLNKVRFFKLKANMENLGVVDKEKLDWKFTLRMEDGAMLALEYAEPYFDKILLDAVCSSEARFVEGEVRTYGYWSEAKIKKMAYLQQKLLLSAWSVLKPGGVLVYSTCTLAPEENESRVSKLLERCEGAVVEEINIPGLKKLSPAQEWKGRVFDKQVDKTFRVLPTKEIEGFFVAKIRKK